MLPGPTGPPMQLLSTPACSRQGSARSGVSYCCPNATTACLYGITQAPVLAAGFIPLQSFLNSGKPLSVLYDIADISNFDTVAVVAFRVKSAIPREP
jgi:CRISPR-associated protein Cas1